MKRAIATFIVGACAVGGLAFAPAASASAATCPGGHYPASLIAGQPTQAKPGMTGAAVWADAHGWHLRVSEAGKDRALFTGWITTDGVIKSVARHTEGGDALLSVGAKRVAFRFVNYGGVDGVDFAVPCSAHVRIAVAMNTKGLPTSEIFLGHSNRHPSMNPFTIHKVS